MIIRDKTFYRTFFSFFLVLVFQNIIRFAVNLTDNIMLGSYQESSLAGATAVNHLQFVLQQAVMGIGSGLVILGTQYWGQNRTRPIRRLSAIAMWFGITAGFLLFAATWLFPRQLLELFTYDKAIIVEGMSYLETIRWSYLFFVISVILMETLRAVEIVRISLYVAIIGLIANFGINFVLIFGRFGFPEMGIRGAGIGTLTARALELSAVLIFLWKKGGALKLRLISFFHIDRVLLKDFVRVTYPLLIVSTLWGLSTAAQTMILGHLDSIAIAANSAANALYLTLKVAMLGACATASIMIGKAIGQGKLNVVKDYAQTLQLIFIVLGLILGAAIYLLRGPFLQLYTLSPQTMAMCYDFLLILSITGVGTSYQLPTNGGIISGGGDTRFIMFLDIISIWGIVLPISALGAFAWNWSPVAVMIALNSDQVFKCVPAFIKVHSYTWIKKLTRAEA